MRARSEVQEKPGGQKLSGGEMRIKYGSTNGSDTCFHSHKEAQNAQMSR